MATPKTYVTDIRHFWEKSGELVSTPPSVRNFANFLALIVTTATQSSAVEHDTLVRCRRKSCPGSIRALLQSATEEITWRCPICKDQGSISNWQGTHWDHSQRE